MNLMGKIFTLLILFMSICFLVVAVMLGATHRDWKAEAAAAGSKATFLNSQINEIKKNTQDKQKRLAAEQAARTLQLAQLESQLASARTKVASKEEQLRSVEADSAESLNRMKEAEKRIVEKDAEVKTLREAVTKYVDDIADQRSAVVTFQNQVYQKSGEVESLSQLNQDLSEQLAVKTRIMKAHGLDDNAILDDVEPSVEGVVARVKSSADANYVAISLGTDDGLRVGHVIDIYRGDRFIGKAVITKAEYNMSVGKVDPAFSQDRVVEGDHVTTKL